MERTFTSGDLTLSYRESGAGAPLVCHPGGPGFSSLYLGELAGLGADRTLIMLNPRGTGSSGRPSDTNAYEATDYAADVEALRLHLGLEQFDLLGHSHGGVVAQVYAATHPGRVGRLVLASTLARFQEEQAEAMFAAIEERSHEPWYADARAALEEEQAGDFADPDYLGELVVREMPFYFARYGERERAYVATLASEPPNADALRYFNERVFTNFDIRGLHGRIGCPALVVTGAEDFITGPGSSREIAAGIAGSKLVLVPGAGHMAFIDQPEAFHSAALGFLQADNES